jgi:hypothetical protein
MDLSPIKLFDSLSVLPLIGRGVMGFSILRIRYINKTGEITIHDE